MTLYECKRRARLLGLAVHKVSKTRLKVKYRISNIYCKDVSELSKAVTKLERQKRKEELFLKLNGHRLKRGYKTVERRKRKKRKPTKHKNGRARAEFERREYKTRNNIIKRVMNKGGIRNGKSGAVRDFGKYSNIPLCCRRKRGLPFDEMADELRMSDEKLWESLVYRR